MYRNIFLFLIITTIAYAAPLFKNGHAHDITLLTQKDDVLFSGDESGMVKAWNKTGDLLASLQISDMPIHFLDFNEKYGLLATISSKPGIASYLNVWSWDLKKQLYTRTLEHSPLSMSLSPEGRFIVYTVFGMDSVRVIYSMNGRDTKMMQNTASLVSDFLVSSNEQRIMTYSASTGTLTYYTMNTGEVIQSIRTQSDIKSLRVLPEKRYASGLYRNGFITIDLLKGNIISTLSYPDYIVEEYALNKNSATLLLRSRQTSAYSVQILDIQSGKTTERERLQPRQNTWKKIALWSDTNILSDETGKLYTLSSDGMQVFASYKSIGIESFYSDTDAITIASKEYVYTFYASVLNILLALEENKKKQLTYQLKKRDPSDPRDWMYDNTQSIMLQSIPETLLDSLIKENIKTIRFAQIIDNYLTFLSGTNTLFLYDMQTETKLMEYTSVDIETAVYVPGSGVFVGASSNSGPLGVSLYRINPDSTETIPMSTPLFFIFDMLFDRENNILWSLGLQEYNGAVRTVLEGRSGPNFEYRWVEKYFLFEGLDTRILLDKTDNSLIFLSANNKLLGEEENNHRSYQVDGSTFLESVQIHNSYHVAINSDKALELRNPRTDAVILTIYLLPEGNWLAFTDTQYISSPGLQDLDTYFNSTTKLNDQRLNVQVRRILQAAE